MLDPDMPDAGNEEGEEMDAVNEDDAAMMTMMGMAGFGSTKVRVRVSRDCKSLSIYFV
jgi:hypothetical protein